MCWWGGEEGEVLMGGATDQTAVPLLDWDGWALWTRTVTKVYKFCLTFLCAPATVHLMVKTWRVSLKSLFTHFGFRLLCFFFCWRDISRFCKATMTLQFSPGSHTLMTFIYGNHSSQQSTWYPDILERNLNSVSMFWMFKANKLFLYALVHLSFFAFQNSFILQPLLPSWNVLFFQWKLFFFCKWVTNLKGEPPLK